MKKLFKYLYIKRLIPVFILCLVSLFSINIYAQNDSTSSKLQASMNLSYKITNGIKSVKVEVTRKVDGKFIPVENLIVNLYLTEIKKYDPIVGDGWMGNLVTNEDGLATFKFTDNFNKLMSKVHVFNFIATTNEDLRYEDMQEEITVNEALINFTFNTEDAVTTVVAKLTKFQDGAEVASPETEMKMLIKRTFGMLPFGEDGLTTDENGEVSAEIPADLPGNANKTITVVARYDDEENNGIIEISKDIPWKILPKVNPLTRRTLWSRGNNAPIPLVIVTVSLIILIWGTICYLVYLLFKIKRLGKTKK